MKRHLLPLIFALPLVAQEPGPRPRGEGPEGRPEFAGEEGRPQGPPPMMPLLEALDLNHDHLIDEKEIAAAVASLKTLDGNGDGKIDEEEFRPKPPGGEGGPEGGPRPQGPPIVEGRGGVPQGNPGGGAGGAGGERRGVMPVIGALDLNRDGKIDPEERAKATASLKVLDKDGDGELSEEEMRPMRAPGGGGGQPGGGQGRPGAGQGGRPGAGGAGPSGGGRPVRPAVEE